LVEVTLLTGGHGAVRQGNSHRRHVRAEARRLDESSPEIKEIRPFSRVLCGRDLLVGAVHQRVSTIAEQSAFRNLGGIQFLSHHGLDRVSPNRNHHTKILRWIWHAEPPQPAKPRIFERKPNLDSLTGELNQMPGWKAYLCPCQATKRRAHPPLHQE